MDVQVLSESLSAAFHDEAVFLFSAGGITVLMTPEAARLTAFNLWRAATKAEEGASGLVR